MVKVFFKIFFPTVSFVQGPTQKYKNQFLDFFFILPSPRLLKKGLRMEWVPKDQLSLAFVLLIFCFLMFLKSTIGVGKDRYSCTFTQNVNTLLGDMGGGVWHFKHFRGSHSLNSINNIPEIHMPKMDYYNNKVIFGCANTWNKWQPWLWKK